VITRRLIVYFFCAIAGGSLCAQSIRGRLTDSLNVAIPYSPVALLKAYDSLIYKGSITSDSGIFVFEQLPPGNYQLKIELPGYEKYTSGSLQADSMVDLAVPTIRLHSSAIRLNEVSVTGFKKSIEFSKGNIIVNVANSALAVGNTAYDLLMRLPGVTLDPVNYNISIQGREGAKVMVDGRVQQLSGRQLINFLQSISAASIEKIEVLKNPPIRYDASGTAGIIHLKTKKVHLYGSSGSITSSASQGFYGRGESGFSLNYKTRKFTVFSNLFSEYGKYIYVNRFNRTINYKDLSTQIDQEHVQTEWDKGLEANAGMDWFVSEKTIVGFKVTADPGRTDMSTRGTTIFSDTSSGYNRLDYYFTMPNVWSYANYNVNAEHRLDTNGGKIRLSVDYSPNQETFMGDFDNRFFNQDRASQPFRIFKSEYLETIYFFSSLVDLEKQVTPGTRISAGLKFNWQQLRRNYTIKNRDALTGNYITDTALTYGFNYLEKIMAGYAQVEQELGDFSIQFGLRTEQTSIGARVPGRSFNLARRYLNFFPLASIEYQASPKHNFQLSYNQRINRPGCYSLIPYKYFWGNLLVTEMGNPGLNPEYSNTVEFTHIYAGKISNALAFSKLNNYLLQYTIQNDSSREMIVTTTNLRHSTTLGYTFSFEARIRNWWEIRGNLTASYNTYSGKVNGMDYSALALGYDGLLTNVFLFPRNMKLEVEGQYFGPEPMGVFRPQPRWALNLALKKSFLKEKQLDLVVGINDVFYTLIGRNTVNFQNQQWKVSETYDSRRMKISLSYTFGKIKVEQRETSSNEEQREKLRH
jgi:iron complex outermembrane recepter protein